MNFVRMALFLVILGSYPVSVDAQDNVGNDVKNYTRNKIVADKSGVNKGGSHTLEMNNGRKYKLENNVLIEYPSIDDIVKIRNLFDFDNGLVYHQDSETGRKITVTPFAQMDPKRVERVQKIACFMVEKRGGNNKILADKGLYDFYKNYCMPQVN
jgi:hypothetical protein